MHLIIISCSYSFPVSVLHNMHVFRLDKIPFSYYPILLETLLGFAVLFHFLFYSSSVFLNSSILSWAMDTTLGDEGQRKTQHGHS